MPASDATRDLSSSLFFLALALYVGITSVFMGLGTPGQPDCGFFPFGGALILGLSSAVTLVQTLRRKPGRGGGAGDAERLRWRNVLFVLLAGVAYTFLLEKVGFVLCTFALFLFILKVVLPQRWPKALIVAGVVAAASHTLFNVLLRALLPVGPWGF